MFYLQNSREYLGNSMLWWSKQGGYTTDLEQAKLFTQDEAQAQHNQRHTDIPWPAEYIHCASKLVVDRQDVVLRPTREAGVTLHLDDIPSASLGRERRHAPEDPIAEGN
jgi:hypothetical protein